MRGFFSFSCGLMGLFLSFAGENLWAQTGAEIQEHQEKTFPLRSLVALEIHNFHGPIIIHGTNQDRIRAVVRWRSSASGVRFQIHTQSYRDREMGLSLIPAPAHSQQKLTPATLEVFAPAQLELAVSTRDQKIQLMGWRGPALLKSTSGALLADVVSSDRFSASCLDCTIQLKQINATLRVVNGSGPVSLEDIQSKKIFVETREGEITLEKIKSATQMYVTKTGNLIGAQLGGEIQFQTVSGMVRLKEISGSLNGHTQSGALECSFREFLASSQMESESGDVHLEFLQGVAVEMDLKTAQSLIQLPAEWAALFSNDAKNQVSQNVVHARLGRLGPTLKVASKSGMIQIQKNSKKN